MQKGIVAKKMEKGFGFIKAEGQDKDLFFHMSELQNASFDDINEGDEVEFEIADGPKGPQAVNVSKI